MANKKNYGKYATPITHSLDSEKYERIRWLQAQFVRHEDYWQSDIERYIRNARMYWHVNFGQWPQFVIDKLKDQGRRPPTFPIIPDKLETLVGSFLANGFDMKFEPMDGKIDSLTMKIQDMWFSDKYNLDWESAEISCLLDSHIMVGYERMKISDQIDAFGNIAWETINPRHTYIDPGWKTDYTRDLKNYFLYDVKTATQIINTYPNHSEHLRALKQREEREGVDYGYNYGGAPRYRTIDEKWASGHKVIEFHHMVESVGWWEYDKKNQCWFPDTGFKPNSKDDRQAKIQYIQMMGIEPDDITMLKRKKKEKRIEAICPDIDSTLFLVSGKDIIQTNNVNLYPLGIRFHGQYQGIVDRLYDTQLAINKGEMTIQDIQQRSAKGAFLLDRALTGGDPELEKQIEQAWNDPAARIWVDEDSLSGAKGRMIQELPFSPPSGDLFNQTNRMYDMADRFSKVPAAQDSRTESSTESGKLFRYKVEVGMVQQKYLLKFYERHKRDKAEAYIQQAKITYAGVPRTFGKVGGKETFEINVSAMDMGSGRKIVLDDISKLPRMKVIIIPSRSGINMRSEIRSQMLEYMGLIADPNDRILRLIFLEQAFATGEFTDEVKEETRRAIEMLKMEAALMTAGNIQDAKNRLMGASAQADKMMQQLNLGQQQPLQEEKAPQQMSFEEPKKQIMMEGTNQDQIFNSEGEEAISG